MATKADRFRYEVERASHNRPKKPRRPRPASAAGTAQPGEAVTGRHGSKAAGKKAPYMLESSRTRPSRKSTRRSANRSKPDSNLKGRQTRATSAPSERARRR